MFWSWSLIQLDTLWLGLSRLENRFPKKFEWNLGGVFVFWRQQEFKILKSPKKKLFCRNDLLRAEAHVFHHWVIMTKTWPGFLKTLSDLHS